MAPTKNSLSIRLAESAVFLRSDYTHSRRASESVTSSRDSLLRGLLVLDLAKPTRITNIEVQLTAVAAFSCPEGIGARRLEVTEHHRVFHDSAILFRSSSPGPYPQKVMTDITSSPYRRSASIGPGVSYTQRLRQATTPSSRDMEESEQIHRENLHAGHDHQAERSTSPTYLSTRHVDRSQLAPAMPSFSTPVPPYSLPPPAEEHPSHSSPSTHSLASSTMRRRPSFSDAILEDESEFTSSNEGQTSAAFTATNGPYTPLRSLSSQPTNSVSSLDQQRGRLNFRTSAAKRFSFSAVPGMLLGAVGSSSPHRGLFSSNDSEGEIQRERSIGRSVSLIRGRRGRTTERREGTRDSTLEDGECSIGRDSREKERPNVLAKLLGEREEWSQEFRPGTYTYPITFSIPASAPPTMQVDYGTISWKLRAFVHRPGAFHSKLSAERDVIIVACPTEEDTEDTESIIVERNWDQQLQYLISISGRAFFIGGTIPISIVLMPMDKVKVHRITVSIEERVEYFTRFQRLIRSDPPVRIVLLSIRNDGKVSIPILPLESSCPDVLRSSPLFELLDPAERRNADRLGELAADFMGPGPWKFHKDIKLPDSCKLMKFSNKNMQATVRIGHLLKVILRLEKAPSLLEEDSLKTKPTLFDIVVQTPVLILSCRCNPEWATLPRYTEVFEGMMHDITPTCPCQARQQSPSSSSTDSLAATTGKGAVPLPASPSLLAHEHDPRHPSEYTESMIRSSSLFERLVSGQECETGEAPPAYDFFDDGTSGRGRSSISVAVREVPVKMTRQISV